MRWLLGPSFEDMLVPLHQHGRLAACIDSPNQAWAYHLDLVPKEQLWILGTADFLKSFCQPPWQGLFHLVAVVNQDIPREVARECTLFLGAGMPLERMGELLNALAWPDSITQGQTQRSSIQGQAHWQGNGALPKALKQVQQGTPIPVLSETALPHLLPWPAAQYFSGLSEPAPLPLILPDHWMSTKTALDALAQLEESHAQAL